MWKAIWNGVRRVVPGGCYMNWQQKIWLLSMVWMCGACTASTAYLDYKTMGALAGSPQETIGVQEVEDLGVVSLENRSFVLCFTELLKRCRRSLGATAVRWFFAFFSVLTRPTVLKLLEVFMYTGGMDFINKYS